MKLLRIRRSIVRPFRKLRSASDIQPDFRGSHSSLGFDWIPGTLKDSIGFGRMIVQPFPNPQVYKSDHELHSNPWVPSTSKGAIGIVEIQVDDSTTFPKPRKSRRLPLTSKFPIGIFPRPQGHTRLQSVPAVDSTTFPVPRGSCGA